jgi:hypothetical protein
LPRPAPGSGPCHTIPCPHSHILDVSTCNGFLVGAVVVFVIMGFVEVSNFRKFVAFRRDIFYETATFYRVKLGGPVRCRVTY